MNKDTAEFIRAVCQAAIKIVNNATLKGAKEKIEASIVDASNYNELQEVFKPAIANRTKAGFITAIEAITSNVEKDLSEKLFNDRVAHVIKRAKADQGLTLNEFEVAAAIRSMPFFSYSAVLQLLHDDHKPTQTGINQRAAVECLRAGASEDEANEYQAKHGDKALSAFLNDVSLKRMRFHYLRVMENPASSNVDRDFVSICLLKVARQKTNNAQVLNLFNDVDALVMGEMIPDGIKRRLISWALAF